MNERLKELARQAKPSPNLIWEDAELERFAELVRQDERDLAKPEQEPCECIDQFWCATFDRCKRNDREPSL